MSASTGLPTWRSELKRVREVLDSSSEAKVLIEEAAGRRLSDLYAAIDVPLTQHQRATLDDLVLRRNAGEPLQHVIGHWPFRNVELFVDQRALIPRPETEQVAETALRELTALRTESFHRGESFAPAVLDLGTGTGAISCALVDEVDDVSVVGVDCSPSALALAQKNIELLSATQRSRITLLQGSWYSALANGTTHSFDLIVANPPYLSEQEWSGLDPVVRDYDPKGALVAGASGLEDLTEIIMNAPGYLRERSAVVCEIGATQGAHVRALGIKTMPDSVVIEQDYAGRDRIFVARFSR